MCILICIGVCCENIAGQIVVCPVTFGEGILAGTGDICVELTWPDTVWDIDSPVTVISLNSSVGHIGSDIELLYRSDDHLGGIREVEFLLIILVLAHREDNLATVRYAITTDKRVGVETGAIRVEERE